MQLLMASKTLDVDLPADSVQTLHWSRGILAFNLGCFF